MEKQYKRVDLKKIERSISKEKSLGIEDITLYVLKNEFGDPLYRIYGELHGKTLVSDIIITYFVYDNDGDIITKGETNRYGVRGLVTHRIKKAIFYDGFPFSIYFFVPRGVEVSRIKLEIDECGK